MMNWIWKYLQHPGKAAVQFRVDTFNVLQGDGFVKQHLVEGSGEPAIYVVPVEHCDAYDAARKMEVGQMFL